MRAPRCSVTSEPRLEIIEKAAGTGCDALPDQIALRVAKHRGARRRRQHAESRERPERGAVEKHGVSLGLHGRERTQARACYGDLGDEGRAGVDASQGNQPLKRRKISEPLVPPNPNEFDNAASIATLRAVFGT